MKTGKNKLMSNTKQRLTAVFVLIFFLLPATILAEDQKARDASTLTLYIAAFCADGKAVVRNILFDGNTFRDSHSVDKEPFVADIIGVIGLIIHRIKITYALVYRTKEFETQREAQRFGAIAVSFTF